MSVATQDLASQTASIGVAHLTPYVSRLGGGIFEIVASLTHELSTQGINVSVVGLEDRCTEADKERWQSIPLQIFKALPPAKLCLSLSLFQYIQRSQWDVLHQHGLWTGVSIASLASRYFSNRPHCISPHGMLDPWALRNSAVRKRIAGALYEWKNLKTAGCIFVNTAAEKDSIANLRLRVPIAVIPNGVSLPAQQLEQTPPTNQVLFLGRIHPKKGVFELVDGWSRLPPQLRSEWKLVMAGWDDGGHGKELRARIAELGLSESIEVPGAVFGAEKAQLLRSSRLFILPSFSEGLPIAVLEAWAHGLPAIITPQCNLEVGVQSGAAIATEATPETICDSLTQMMQTAPASLTTMGQRGRALVENSFTWRRVAQMHAVTYQWVLGNVPKPDWVFQ